MSEKKVEITKQELDSVQVRLLKAQEAELSLVCARESLNYTVDKIKEKYNITTNLKAIDTNTGVLIFADEEKPETQKTDKLPIEEEKKETPKNA